MHVHVTVELDGDDLVVVKSGSGGETAERLRTEARRLDRARHPGVVALLDAGPIPDAAGDPGDAPTGDGPGDAYALRLAHAGEPVTHWRASVPDLAGVAAAVASTLADLHDLGLVHGRLDASHVLIGSDGRPRLCSLGDPGAATPEDDVAAWGRLVAELLARTVNRPRDMPRRRARGGGRRSRAGGRALARICDRATDPVASRRPTARATADAVVAAVPDAALPAGTPPGRRPDGDTLDRIWSYSGEPSEAERWAAAFGTAPDDAEVPVAGDAVRTPDDLPLALDPAPGWDQLPGDGGAPATHTPGHDPWFDRDPDRRVPPLPARAPGNRGGEHDRAAAADDAATRDHRPVGLVRRPLAPDRAPRDGARARRVLAAALGAVALGGGLLVARAGDGASPPAAAGDACPAVDEPAADVDGDGCPEALTVDGATVDAGVARWTLGDPGDVVAVGDWDCDGQATAALLRPSTGDVFHFPAWAAIGERLTVSPVRRVSGATSLRRADGADPACDRLVVERSDGTFTDVAVAP